jgi:HK97 family phage portal protein
MRLLGWEITRKAAPPGTSPVNDFSRGWWPIVREPFTGAWQRNLETNNETVLTYHAVYSCVSLIASDISKCRLKLVEQGPTGIWKEFKSAAFSPVIRKPNHYQNRIQFYEQWVISKLLQGNTYALKARDERRVVVALYILDPTRVKVLIASDGAVWYELHRDNLSGLGEDSIAVPASEIIHDVMTPLYHPLCGVSPLTACAIPAAQGLAIQANSGKFFANGSMPGGILTAPGHIDDETAARLKTHWEDKFAGNNVGKIAVLGDGLKFEQLAIRAIDAQLIEQLKWTAETVCSAFHVPSFMVGVGAAPAYNNIEALNQQYYSQCLQKFFESIELCLDEGLGLTEVKSETYGVEFDLDDLLRMDTRTLVEAEARAVGAGIKAPDESRLRLNLGPVKGGHTPYLQQQNYSLAALDERDRSENPFGSNKPEPTPAAQPAEPPPEEPGADESDVAKRLVLALQAKMIHEQARIPA